MLLSFTFDFVNESLEFCLELFAYAALELVDFNIDILPQLFIFFFLTCGSSLQFFQSFFIATKKINRNSITSS